MKKYNGKSIFKGIAIGDILFYQKEKQQVKRQRVEDVVKEKSGIRWQVKKHPNN